MLVANTEHKWAARMCYHFNTWALMLCQSNSKCKNCGGSMEIMIKMVLIGVGVMVIAFIVLGMMKQRHKYLCGPNFDLWPKN